MWAFHESSLADSDSLPKSMTAIGSTKFGHVSRVDPAAALDFFTLVFIEQIVVQRHLS